MKHWPAPHLCQTAPTFPYPTCPQHRATGPDAPEGNQPLQHSSVEVGIHPPIFPGTPHNTRLLLQEVPAGARHNQVAMTGSTHRTLGQFTKPTTLETCILVQYHLSLAKLTAAGSSREYRCILTKSPAAAAPPAPNPEILPLLPLMPSCSRSWGVMISAVKPLSSMKSKGPCPFTFSCMST